MNTDKTKFFNKAAGDTIYRTERATFNKFQFIVYAVFQHLECRYFSGEYCIGRFKTIEERTEFIKQLGFGAKLNEKQQIVR